MLRTRLFLSFALLILVFGILSAWFGVDVLRDRVVTEAQNRVRLDLSSARAVLSSELREIKTVVALTAGDQAVAQACAASAWQDSIARARLETTRQSRGLDFLSLVSVDGTVRLRAASPNRAGDTNGQDPLILEALNGAEQSGIQLLDAVELEQEAGGLAEQALLELKPTPRARPTDRTEEQRGMVLMAAAPVYEDGTVVGALYGGVLLNRNTRFADRLKDVIYGDEVYQGSDLGTATVFLDDRRITTTVRKNDGSRALGTRVSKEVADQVLDQGEPWISRAFVVNRWYLTAYEAIRDPTDAIIGMLYVGILEQPFLDMAAAVVWQFVAITAGVMLLSLFVAYLIAGRLAEPIHRLAEAARQMRVGAYPEPVATHRAGKEIDALTEAFDEMTVALREREAGLNEANTSLQTLNRNYMETLGFVSHEMNSPVSSMTNYIYMFKNRMIGDLTEQQEKAVRVLDRNLGRISEMIRHYLNLSRIERGELRPSRVEVAVNEDVIVPILETLEPQVESAKMQVGNEVGDEVVVEADPGMLREIFENLLSNAVKYGREDGRIMVSSRIEGGTIEFVVFNEGAGIPPDKFEHLFRRFSRVGDRRSASARGTGLGLFIAKSLVEAHGGTITADSTPEEWASFTFTLPHPVPEKGTEP